MSKTKLFKRGLISSPAFWWMLGGIALAQTAGIAAYEEFTAQEESGGNLAASNPSSTAIGEYQLTEAQLEEAGFGTETSPVSSSDYDGSDANFTFNGTDGIDNLQEFEASPQAQTAAFIAGQQANYTALEANGATSYLGQTVNGQVINQSALLAGSQLLGAGGMDSYLENGGEVLNADGTVNEALTADAQARIAQGSQYDTSAITGTTTTTVADSDPNGTDVGSSAVNGMYCDPNVASIIGEGAQAAVQGERALAEAPGTGFTLLNGNTVQQALGGSGSSIVGAGNFSQFSCLSNLLNGDLDILFEPPSLSQLLNQFENAVCADAENMITQVTEPLNTALFQTTNVGGFFPGLNVGSLGSGIQSSFSTGGSQSGVNFSLGGNGGSTTLFQDNSNTGASSVFFNNGLLSSGSSIP